MDTEPKEESKTLDDVLIDFSRDLWPSLAYILTVSAVIYFAVKPETFIVTAMGIFHLPPQVLMSFYAMAMPLVLSAMLSRFLVTVWRLVLPGPIAIIVLIIVSPFLLLDEYILRRNWSERIYRYLDQRRLKAKSKKNRKFLLSNVVLFCSFSILLFACYLGNNAVSSLWLPSRNAHMVIISYNHYYCQVTGNYNESECKYWKKVLAEYRVKNSIPTPVDYPKDYPEM